MKTKRVVITGMGLCSPLGNDCNTFDTALREGHSGASHQADLAQLGFRCTVGALPAWTEALESRYLTDLERKRLGAMGLKYGLVAGLQAWEDAGLPLNPSPESKPHYQWGCLMGSGLSGIQSLHRAIYETDAGRVKRLGSAVVEQTMPSGISALLGGKLGLGNWVSTNASACSTGTEALFLASEHIRRGGAELMLAGSTDAGGPHVWGGFDAMRVLATGFNNDPAAASRPMAADASGFVPGAGAGALVLESLDHALQRGATIYAEISGGAVNSGGQRGNGSMTAPNDEAVQYCIRQALQSSATRPEEIDLICGHLTSTMGDRREVYNWHQALHLPKGQFPFINAFKSLAGHCLSAAGALESIAAVLQLQGQYVHGSRNCEKLHPEIAALIPREAAPCTTLAQSLQTIAKCSFGFGDVNACILFKKYFK